jgi:uncharacterized DUF497 family protein
VLRFEWDEGKNRLNQLKHGVSFEEASSVFYDDDALLLADPDHSEDEDRFLLLGLNSALRILIVSHCYRSGEGVIRIISGRTANRMEREQYARGWSR